MANPEQWVGIWRPHKPRGPISAHFLSPGPKYAMPGLTGAFKHDPTKDKAPMFSLGTRHVLASCDHSPGPKYLIPSNITRLGRDGIPAFICYRHKKEPGLLTTPGPGPAAYTLPAVVGPKASPSFSLSGLSKSRSFLSDLKRSPGPAAYKVVDPGIYKEKLPQYSITGRNFTPNCSTKTPGPGSHYPERVSITKPQTPSFSFGIRHSQYVVTPQ